MSSSFNFLNPGALPKQVPPPGGGTLSPVVFTTVSGLTESPAGQWHGLNGYGVSNVPLTGDGFFQTDLANANNKDVIIGLDSSASNTDYTTYDFLLDVDGPTGEYLLLENGGGMIHTGIFLTYGEKGRIRRSGVTMQAEKSTDGTTWTLLAAYVATSSAALYPKGMVVTNDGYILNPKIFQ
jgi:hypothetical protein